MKTLITSVRVPLMVLGLGLFLAGCSEDPDKSSKLLSNEDGTTTPIESGSGTDDAKSRYENMGKGGAQGSNTRGVSKTPNKTAKK